MNDLLFLYLAGRLDIAFRHDGESVVFRSD